MDDAVQSVFPVWVPINEIRDALQKSPLLNDLESVHCGLKLWKGLEKSREGRTSAGIKTVENISCLLRGKDAEAGFQISFQKKFGSTMFAATTRWDDIKRRIDVLLKVNNIVLAVDVKASKALRWKGKLQNRYVWLELHKQGSLFSGDSSVIAQAVDEENNTFVLLSKKEMQKYVLEKFKSKSNLVYFPEQSLYRAYKPKKGVGYIGLVDLLDAVQVAGIAIV